MEETMYGTTMGDGCVKEFRVSSIIAKIEAGTSSHSGAAGGGGGGGGGITFGGIRVSRNVFGDTFHLFLRFQIPFSRDRRGSPASQHHLSKSKSTTIPRERATFPDEHKILDLSVVPIHTENLKMLRSPLHMEKIEYHDDSSGSDGSSSSQGGRQHRRTTSGGVWREVPYVKNDATTYEGTMNREEKSYTWTQLNAIENRRRAILRRGGLPFWQVLTYYDGTVLTVLSRAYVMWITMGIYCFIRLQARFDSSLSKFVQDLGDSDIGIIGGFLSFFLVLFVNQSNSRFNEMYQTSMSVSSRVLDISSLVATSFPKPNAQRIIRYLNAAHAAGYVGISKIYSRRHFFDHLNSDYCFLHTVELKRLGEIDMDCGADASHEIIQWCMADVQRAFKDDHVSAREAGVLKDKLLQFRGSMDTLYDYCDQPIHFFYVHFLCLLSILYLPLFAVDNAYSAGTGDQVHWTSDVLQ